MRDSAPSIAFEHVAKTYGGTVEALAGVSFTAGAGCVTALMGASGSGKTTLLRLVNRMETPSAGRVLIDGAPVADRDPVALRRGIGYVIQEGGLFPHWSAGRNVGLVPALIGCSPADTAKLVASAMDLARIPYAEFAARYPAELSGGQRQRVAIARAIATRPRLLLLDEPFSALDPAVRGELQGEMRDLARQLGMTVLMVTHDIAEAFAVADRIVLIDHGRVIQIGTPAELALAPVPVSAAFIARQSLELKLRYLRLGEVAAYLARVDGSAEVELAGSDRLADALAALARVGGERFAVLHGARRLGPFERSAVWELLTRAG